MHERGTRVKGGICRNTVLVENILASCKLSARKIKADIDLVASSSWKSNDY